MTFQNDKASTDDISSACITIYYIVFVLIYFATALRTSHKYKWEIKGGHEKQIAMLHIKLPGIRESNVN